MSRPLTPLPQSQLTLKIEVVYSANLRGHRIWGAVDLLGKVEVYYHLLQSSHTNAFRKLVTLFRRAARGLVSWAFFSRGENYSCVRFILGSFQVHFESTIVLVSEVHIRFISCM